MIIPGLTHIEGFLNPSQQEFLVKRVSQGTWERSGGVNSRLVQHYGYRYNYTQRSVTKDFYLGEMPDYLSNLCRYINKHSYMAEIPDQVIINKYLPGQGIAPHVDCIPCFEDTIVSLSLGSQCVMDFKKIGSLEKTSLLLNPGDLLILSGEARYQWTHAIASRDYDMISDVRVDRDTRISITLRKVVLT